MNKSELTNVVAEAADISKLSAANAIDAMIDAITHTLANGETCLLYTSPSPRDGLLSRMPSSA